MLDSVVKQLASSDAATRKKAIIALGKSVDQAALPHLAKIVKNDPDPELRELALKAGRYIKRQTQEFAAVAPADEEAYTPLYNDDSGNGAYTPQYSSLSRYYQDDTTESSLSDSAHPYYASDDNDGNAAVSQADRERAQSLVTNARKFHEKKDLNRASEALVAALKLNPLLRRDREVVRLASAITGKDSFTAIQALQQQVEDTRSKARKKTNQVVSSGGVSWWVVIGLLLIYFAVNVGMGIASYTYAADGLITYDNLRAFNGEERLDAALLNSYVDGYDNRYVMGVVSGVVSVISTILMMLAIHTIAIGMRGGDGFLTDQAVRVLPIYCILTLIWNGVLIYWFNHVVDLSNSVLPENALPQAVEGIVHLVGIIICSGLIAFFGIAFLLSKYYGIETGHAFSMQVMAGIVSAFGTNILMNMIGGLLYGGS